LLHQESIVAHGGVAGLRNAGDLEAALAYPLNLLVHGDLDIAALAAAYGVALAKSRAFVHGNDRAAFLGIGLFLSLNGWHLTASQPEATHIMRLLASESIDEAALADWIRANL
jgi:death-on-curing protein